MPLNSVSLAGHDVSVAAVMLVSTVALAVLFRFVDNGSNDLLDAYGRVYVLGGIAFLLLQTINLLTAVFYVSTGLVILSGRARTERA